MAMPGTDAGDLAKFGDKQELDRSLRGRAVSVLAEHRAGPAPAVLGAVGEEA